MRIDQTASFKNIIIYSLLKHNYESREVFYRSGNKTMSINDYKMNATTFLDIPIGTPRNILGDVDITFNTYHCNKYTIHERVLNEICDLDPASQLQDQHTE